MNDLQHKILKDTSKNVLIHYKSLACLMIFNLNLTSEQRQGN